MLTDVLLDALKDSALILPFLFIVYVLIELIEQKYIFGVKTKKVLRGKYAPILGAGVGLVPQCGFSVMATDLYLTRYISMGTLTAVYIATSDEAIPILLSNFESAPDLLPILGIKLIFAVLMGYLVDLVTRKYQMGRAPLLRANVGKPVRCGCGHAHTHEHTENPVHAGHDCCGHEHPDNKDYSPNINAVVDESVTEDAVIEESVGCCNHKLKPNAKERSGPEWVKSFLLHPLKHSLKIFLFIFVINFIFGWIIEGIGEAKVMSFMSQMSWNQPALTGLVGLIPNCASSVVITQMYVLGGISMGACITGLSVNSGVAFAVLLRKSADRSTGLLLILAIYTASVILGIILTLIGL